MKWVDIKTCIANRNPIGKWYLKWELYVRVESSEYKCVDAIMWGWWQNVREMCRDINISGLLKFSLKCAFKAKVKLLELAYSFN